MSARVIDGKACAEALRKKIAEEVSTLSVKPGLAVVLVGHNPASEVYVKNKAKHTVEAGMASFEHMLPESTTQETLLALIAQLNADARVHGILVQLPLPEHINEDAVINAVDPKKDVDGFHILNAGLLATGQEGFVPCTPLGCLMLIKNAFEILWRSEATTSEQGERSLRGAKEPEALSASTLSGLHAVVIGRSNIVGKPMAALLLKEHCTVTIVHSRTQNVEDIVRHADIVVAAVGKPEMVRGSWIKKGAVVIDVGINRISLADGKTKLVGDVCFEEVVKVASAITPVPGGVGPMTIACLLANTLKAAKNV